MKNEKWDGVVGHAVSFVFDKGNLYLRSNDRQMKLDENDEHFTVSYASKAISHFGCFSYLISDVHP